MTEDDEDARQYPDPEATMPVVPVAPFTAYAESRQSDGLVEARVLAIRQNPFFPDQFEFIVVTSESGRLYCEAHRYLEGELPAGGT